MVSTGGGRRNRRNIIGLVAAQGRMLKERLARVARRVSQDASECNRDMGIAYGMTRPTRRPRMAAAGIAATVALGLLLGGCFSETYQRGYIVPDGALEQIPIGSTQEQVLIVLGTPSTVATVSGEAFYYISQRSERPIGFMPQQVVDQRVVAIYFDKGRRVERLANYGFKGGKIFDFVGPPHPRQGLRLRQRHVQAVLDQPHRDPSSYATKNPRGVAAGILPSAGSAPV